jgi:hypothetical protein
MARYRLYFMSVDGHILNGIDIMCEDDAEAIAEVEKRGEVRPVELWLRSRQVKVFPAKPVS